MKNPFVVMAMAAVAMQQMFRDQALMSFQAGNFIAATQQPTHRKNSGLTVAGAKRASIKAKNRAKHRAACRG